MEPVAATNRLTDLECPIKAADLDNKSKGELQDLVIPHKSKWPIQSMGKFTQKMNMEKMHGFTICGLPLQPLSDVPEAGRKGDEGISEPDLMDVGVSESTPLASNGNLDGGHPQSFKYSSTTFETTNLDSVGPFHVPDMPEMATLSDSQQNVGMTWMGVDVKPYKRHCGPAKQASFARAKNGPKHIFMRQQAKNQMHNQGAVKSWTFVVKFKEAYNRLKLVNGRYKKIKICNIKTALAIGGAWLCDAEKAVNIIQMFDKGGTHQSVDVITKVMSTEEKEGSTKLLAWLKN
ncbi:hypothetical protein PILCRDRAFT_91036 [Piloderma croceum F 1598]|uniref:Uncharacterized protein n=1 Tax=Piloderma croceum (strain F 1598) TaxID=765440 RepID=A0A0C3FD28_PILCF|nr:hypothetical protein PILCRDRAFT_91036 [Piloderma croceum F 1598]